MKGIHSDCIESLKESGLYDYFIWIAEATCINNPELHWIDVNSIPMNETVEILKQHAPTISKEVLKRNIQRLIHKGLLKYSDHKIDYIDNFEDTQAPLRDNKYFKSLLEFEKNVTDESNIELSQNAQISGRELYKAILDDACDEKLRNDFENSFQAAIDEGVKEYKSYVDKTKDELEKRLKDVENSTIKSIEIISVFAAIISLLVVNMSSIATFAEKGLSSVLLINASTIVCIFFLLLFTRVIVCEKGGWKEIIKWIFLVAIFLFLMAFLIA